MYVEGKIEALTCNHCSSAKALSIVYCECVIIALCMQHAMRMHHIICALSDSRIFLLIIS
jgi:hypothetical protein